MKSFETQRQEDMAYEKIRELTKRVRTQAETIKDLMEHVECLKKELLEQKRKYARENRLKKAAYILDYMPPKERIERATEL